MLYAEETVMFYMKSSLTRAALYNDGWKVVGDKITNDMLGLRMPVSFFDSCFENGGK